MEGRDPSFPFSTSDLLHVPSTVSAATSEAKLNPLQQKIANLSLELDSQLQGTVSPHDSTSSSLSSILRYVTKIAKCDTLFGLEEFKVHYLALKKYAEIPLEEVRCFASQTSRFPKVETDFLRLNFQAAHMSLLYIINNKLGPRIADGLNYELLSLALQIAAEEKEQFDKNRWDDATLLESIERLYRVRIALEKPLDETNNQALGLLAERSGSKSYWWFFLGLVILGVSIALALATHGVAVPYMAPLAKLCFAPELAEVGALSGVGLIIWRQYKDRTPFCCFWHTKHAQESSASVSAQSPTLQHSTQ